MMLSSNAAFPKGGNNRELLMCSSYLKFPFSCTHLLWILFLIMITLSRLLFCPFSFPSDSSSPGFDRTYAFPFSFPFFRGRTCNPAFLPPISQMSVFHKLGSMSICPDPFKIQPTILTYNCYRITMITYLLQIQHTQIPLFPPLFHLTGQSSANPIVLRCLFDGTFFLCTHATSLHAYSTLQIQSHTTYDMLSHNMLSSLILNPNILNLAQFHAMLFFLLTDKHTIKITKYLPT